MVLALLCDVVRCQFVWLFVVCRVMFRCSLLVVRLCIVACALLFICFFSCVLLSVTFCSLVGVLCSLLVVCCPLFVFVCCLMFVAWR